MIINIDIKNVKLNNQEILDELRLALGINPNWTLYNGKVIDSDDLFYEHREPDDVGYSPKVFEAYQTIKKALSKKS